MGVVQQPLLVPAVAVESLAIVALAQPFAALATVPVPAMLRRSAGSMLQLGIKLVL